MTVNITYSADKTQVTMPAKQWKQIEKRLNVKAAAPKYTKREQEILDDFAAGLAQMASHIKTGEPKLKNVWKMFDEIER